MKTESDYKKLKAEFEQFVYIVSHDFNGPIRAISNLSDWIAEDLVEVDLPDVKSNLNLLKSRAIRLQKMLDGAKRISRISRDNLKIEQFNTKERLLLILASPAFENKISVELKGDYPEIETYSKKFDNVFEEIFINAIRFSKKGNSNAVITGAEVDGNFEIKISDNGIGIRKNVLNKITDLYYTAAAKDEAEGIGIGLYYIQSVMNFIQGSLEIESEENEGTEVKVIWPIKLKKQ